MRIGVRVRSSVGTCCSSLETSSLCNAFGSSSTMIHSVSGEPALSGVEGGSGSGSHLRPAPSPKVLGFGGQAGTGSIRTRSSTCRILDVGSVLSVDRTNLGRMIFPLSSYHALRHDSGRARWGKAGFSKSNEYSRKMACRKAKAAILSLCHATHSPFVNRRIWMYWRYASRQKIAARSGQKTGRRNGLDRNAFIP